MKIQAAGAGRQARTGSSASKTSASSRRNDTNNFQPRIGAVLDLRGNGKDIVRGGWGIYTDFGYTNSNVLFAAADATGKGFGQCLQRQQPGGHPQSRRQLLPRPASR